jgi:hypothetical protein
MRIPFIGHIVGRSGKVVDRHHRWAQVGGAQPRGDREIFVMVYG